MTQYREEVLTTSVEPDASVVEQRTVQDDGIGSRVVHTATTTAPPGPAGTTRTVRRWWRQEPLGVAGTEYATAPSYALDPGLAHFLRISWFVLGLIEAVLALRFMLSLLGANERNEFAAAVYGLTWPLVAPFRTLFGTPASGGSVLELHTLVAMLVLFLFWWAAVKTIGVVLNRSVDV